MVRGNVLVVDDDPQIRTALADRLVASGYGVGQSANGAEGLTRMGREQFDVVLLDLQMPEMDGMEMLARIQEEHSDVTVIVLTAHGTIEHAVEAMKRGAYDFLPKPCEPDHILLTLEKALERKGLRDENRYLRETLKSQYHMVVGASPLMRDVMDVARRAATTNTTVLVTGESGTGKQLLARAIHDLSDRKQRPFVHVNCTTLSEQLMESDVFGHEKGAFTGAIKQKKGRFELADGGTLFLDEVGELSPSIQAKLLHAIEYGEFQRVGGVQTLRADVRVLAATNRDLPDEISEGRFREDLFYRLNVLAVRLPPLRERPEDILLLTDNFIAKHNRAMGKQITGVTPEAAEVLRRYSWPGNIRELENAIQRAIVLASDPELGADLFSHLKEPSEPDEPIVGETLEAAMKGCKKRFITKILQHTGGNQTKAAELLQIQRTYLNRLIKELDIKP
jgi:DNA-binding NtrC family response regulator